MRLPQFEYIEPKTLREASKALVSDRRTVLLAGGTDLLVNMKHRVIEPRKVINLKALPKLNHIAREKEGLRMGALTTLHDISSSPAVKEQFPALALAAGQVGAYAHQAMGTLGGNLCQGNRCRFYNQSAPWRGVRPLCFKAGGKVCYVVPKSKECYSAYCGDLAPVLIALDAVMKIAGPAAERSAPLKKLYTHNGLKPFSLKKGEILKEILIPPSSGRTLYLKWRFRDSLEFAILSLALHIEKDGKGHVKNGKIIFSGVGRGPVEAVSAEKEMKGVRLDDATIENVSNQGESEISPMRTSLHSPAYKRKMACILLKQGLEQISQQ
jgi:4-hydroxybenzoyl-CoA reductase subunit beta